MVSSKLFILDVSDGAAAGEHVVFGVILGTGTGGGINLFCGGYGLDTPDVAMASRRMKETSTSRDRSSEVSEPPSLPGLEIFSSELPEVVRT